MHQWTEHIQKVIDYIEEHIYDMPLLSEIAENLGYSPYYLSVKFHAVAGLTLKDYIARRRLAMAAMEIRDTNTSLLEIATKYGYSSQQSLTRAFTGVYGITPALYRKNPRALPLLTKKEVLFPDDSSTGLSGFASGILKTHTRLEYIPEHTILGILDPNTTDYFGFTNRHDMEHLSSMLQEFAPLSHPCLFYPAGARYLKDNRQGYFYGIGLEQAPKADHETVRSLQLFHVPASYYMVFCHPPFRMETEGRRVVRQVEFYASNYSIQSQEMKWHNSHSFIYQRFLPEDAGYELLRPVLF